MPFYSYIPVKFQPHLLLFVFLKSRYKDTGINMAQKGQSGYRIGQIVDINIFIRLNVLFLH